MKDNLKDIIYFFHPADDYGYLSNFYKTVFLLEGYLWASSEHYYQSKKFEGTSFERAIRTASSPGEAARLGRASKPNIRKDWDEIKIDVMWTAIAAKFIQNEKLRAMLLETGEATIVEHSSKDAFWGDGGDGAGRNILGELLMALRGRLSADLLPDSIDQPEQQLSYTFFPVKLVAKTRLI